MPPMRLAFSGGVVTARDRSELGPTEMVEATGGFYRPGDLDRIHKLGGRSTFGDTGSAAEVKGIALCQFDAGDADLLVAYRGTEFFKATPGATGSFESFSPGVTGVAGDGLSSAHANDRWYLCTGSANRVIESDGSVRSMGLIAPQEAPVLTALVQGGSAYDYADSTTAGNFTNPTRAYDTDNGTNASATLSASSATLTEEYNWGEGSVGSNPTAYVLWSLKSENTSDAGHLGRRDFEATVKIERSIDGVPTYPATAELEVTLDEDGPLSWFAIDMTGLTDPGDANVKITVTLNAVNGVTITLYVYTVLLAYTSLDNDAVDATLTYAITEFNANTNRRSARSDLAEITLESSSNHNGVQLDFSTVTQRNTDSTHYEVWRTPNSGTATQLGRIGLVSIDNSVFYDFFNEFGINDQPEFLLPLLSITAQGTTQYYAQDIPPPALRRITAFQGALCGLGNNNKRALYYSIPGEYESWPVVYRYNKFPLKEHDELVDFVPVGSSLVISAKAAMIRMDELPQVISGNFVARVSKIEGAPGCVGDYAMAGLSMAGEQAAAWVSPYGLYITNGHTHTRISDDIDWTGFATKDMSAWVLEWNPDMLALKFCYSSVDGGANDRFALIHMDPQHRKENGQPKWTLPHYGAINALVGAQVSNVYRQYSAHPSNGIVYLENNSATGADSSNALDTSGTHRLKLKSGRRYDGWQESAVIDARLRHTDFGTGQTCTVAHLVGRDSSGHESTRSQTVSLAGHKATQFDISRSGDYHETTLTHDGTGLGSIHDLILEVQRQGRAGSQVGK